MTAIINIWLDSDFKTAASYLKPNLEETFSKDVNIRYVNTKQLQEDQTWDPSKVLMMIIPPVMGEKCNYEEAFTPSIFKKKSEYIRKGGVTFETCAPAYQAFPKFKFTSPTTGETFERTSSTPLFESGLAYGPLESLGRGIDSENRYSDCIVTPIRYGKDDEIIEFGCCYGNGCTFVTDDRNVEVWAQYTHNAHPQSAMLKKSIGKGFTVVSGMVPQYKHEKNTIAALRDLNDALKPHEPERLLFIQSVFGEIARHSVNRGIITDTPNYLRTPLANIGRITPL